MENRQKPNSVTYNIDCMEYMKTLPDKYFDLCIADPPYRDDNAPTQCMRKVESNKKMFVAGAPSEDMFNEIIRVSKEQIFFGANNYGRPFKGFVAWDKQIRGDVKYSHVELASLSDGLGTISRLCSIPCFNKGVKIHPTQKVVELYEWLFTKYAKEGWTIFDPFLGSQSSRIAAHKLGFDFVGCELDKDYYEAGEKRFNDYKSQLTLF